MARLAELMRRYERGRRFWRHVEVGGREDCWEWSGADSESEAAAAHAYQLVRGALPPGARLMHRCGSTHCMNPEHMDVVYPA